MNLLIASFCGQDIVSHSQFFLSDFNFSSFDKLFQHQPVWRERIELSQTKFTSIGYRHTKVFLKENLSFF